jgi:hypothetical protein
MININVYQVFNSYITCCLSTKISSELSDPMEMRVMHVEKGDNPIKEGVRQKFCYTWEYIQLRRFICSFLLILGNVTSLKRQKGNYANSF